MCPLSWVNPILRDTSKLSHLCDCELIYYLATEFSDSSLGNQRYVNF
jgi:hypothetical protein